MALVQIRWLSIGYDVVYRTAAVAWADANKTNVTYPGSVQQMLTHVAAQSVDIYVSPRGWVSRTHSFIRQDFMPTAVPFLRNLFTPALPYGAGAVVNGILEAMPDPFPTDDPAVL